MRAFILFLPGRPTCPLTVAFFALVLQSSGATAAPVFPTNLELTEAGSRHSLDLTGATERKFLFLRVYEIAHYHESTPPPGPLEREDVLTDGPTKALAIRFNRTLGRERIRAEFERTIRRNARSEWIERAGSTIEDFVEAIDRGAEAGDRLVYYWLDGGRLIAEFNNERFFSVTSPDFAKLIWSIWFGENPVSDSEALLIRSGGAAEP